MMRQSSSRIQRSKGGFRLKHVLQICLLLAICTWLLYQIKHSHDKKRAFEERISKISTKTTEKPPDLFNFGRKGLPLVNDNDSMATARAKEVNSEEGQGEEGEQDAKRDENEDEEAKGDGGDGIDELDQDRGDDENEQEEEEQFTDEDGKDGRVDADALFDNEEREDSAQEAREENYKRDDVSSAVTHDAHAGDLNTRGLDEEQENEAINGTVGDETKNSKNTALDYVDSASNLSNAAIGENTTVSNADFHMNGSHPDPNGPPEVEITKSENGSISTPLSTEGGSQKELQPNTTISGLPENNSEVTAIPAGNLTESLPEYQNTSKSDDSLSVGEIHQHGTGGLTTVQDQNNPDIEIHPQNSTTSTNEVTAQVQPENLSQNAVTGEQSEFQTELSTLPVIKNEDKQAEDRAAE